MKVRAKVTVSAIELYRYPQGSTRVKFSGVYDSKTPENNSFAKSTPCLELTMTVDNPPAGEVFKAAFESGKSFYLDFTEAPE